MYVPSVCVLGCVYTTHGCDWIYKLFQILMVVNGHGSQS